MGTTVQEVKGDLWKLPADVICITTNGTLNKSKKATMGRGCALEAKTKYPVIQKWLGLSLIKYGNHVVDLGIHDGKRIFSFPVKNNWWEEADIKIITRSAWELRDRIEPWNTVLLPRPGCGNGRLQWEDVKPCITEILPDNVFAVSK